MQRTKAPRTGNRLFRITVCVVLVVLGVGCLYELCTTSVWVGHYDLTIVVDSDQQFDFSRMRFATCRTHAEAEFVRKNPAQREIQFQAAQASAGGDRKISVMCSGRRGPFGLSSTYHQPSFLLAELKGFGEESRQCKSYPLPKGSGARRMEIRVP